MLWNPLAVPTCIQALCGLLLLLFGAFPGQDIMEKSVLEQNNVELDIVEKDIVKYDEELKVATFMSMAEMIRFQHILFIFVGIFLLLVAATGYFVLVRKSVLLNIICILSNVSVIILQLTVLLVFQGTHFQKQFHTVVLIIVSLAIFSSIVCILMVFRRG
jgi:hypothetical protein